MKKTSLLLLTIIVILLVTSCTCNHPSGSIVTDSAVAPTCLADGLTEGSHCEKCGEVITAQMSVPALGHTVVIDEAKPATCTEDGLTEGSHCSVCGEVIVAQEAIPAGHTVVIDAAVPSTCISEGLTEGSHCSVCGEVIVAQEKTQLSEHTVVIDGAVEPTCHSEGLTEGSHCSVCGEVFHAQETVAMTAHTPVAEAVVMATVLEDGRYGATVCSECGTVISSGRRLAAYINNFIELFKSRNDSSEDIDFFSSEGITTGQEFYSIKHLIGDEVDGVTTVDTYNKIYPCLTAYYLAHWPTMSFCTYDDYTTGTFTIISDFVPSGWKINVSAIDTPIPMNAYAYDTKLMEISVPVSDIESWCSEFFGTTVKITHFGSRLDNGLKAYHASFSDDGKSILFYYVRVGGYGGAELDQFTHVLTNCVKESDTVYTADIVYRYTEQPEIMKSVKAVKYNAMGPGIIDCWEQTYKLRVSFENGSMRFISLTYAE